MFYTFAKGLVTFLFSLIFRIKIINKENLNVKGSAILCSNHVHWSDPLFLAIALKRKAHFMAKKSLFNNKLLGKILNTLGCIPVNRDGSDLVSTRKALNVLKNNEILGLFPQGTRRNDLEGCKPGVAAIALISKAQIIPVYMEVDFKFLGVIKIVVGDVFTLDEYYDKKIPSHQYDEIAQKDIFNKIIELKGE